MSWGQRRTGHEVARVRTSSKRRGTLAALTLALGVTVMLLTSAALGRTPRPPKPKPPSMAELRRIAHDLILSHNLMGFAVEGIADDIDANRVDCQAIADSSGDFSSPYFDTYGNDVFGLAHARTVDKELLEYLTLLEPYTKYKNVLSKKKDRAELMQIIGNLKAATGAHEHEFFQLQSALDEMKGGTCEPPSLQTAQAAGHWTSADAVNLDLLVGVTGLESSKDKIKIEFDLTDYDPYHCGYDTATSPSPPPACPRTPGVPEKL